MTARNPGDEKDDKPELHLVSGARPLTNPSRYEIERLKDVRRLIEKEVLKEASFPRDHDPQIDQRRSGGILVIDGERGAGKTSFMLTMLHYWRGPAGKEGSEPWAQPIEGFKVLFPVLDFDPLPEGMPLHAWLLEPWRLYLDKLPQTASCDELKESLAELVDKAILGWTPAAKASDAGVVARALAYREQTSGWAGTGERWRSFVNGMVCSNFQCTAKPCLTGHKHLFVIAIDDLDLQVEQIPNLLKAVRLLEHPNVLYILTGDLDHLRFAVELDYLGRHQRVAGEPLDGGTSNGIQRWSRRLTEALIRKTLPKHAIVRLPWLTLADVADLEVGQRVATVRQRLDDGERVGFDEPWARELKFVTARQAQHTIDRQLPAGRQADALRFLADLCGTEISAKLMSPGASDEGVRDFALRGRLTTTLAEPLRIARGDDLEVIIHKRPTFAFEPDFDIAEREEGDGANRAAIVQRLVERPAASPPTASPPTASPPTASPPTASQLHWNPVAGIMATHVNWRWEGKEAKAIFHWPWLTRPTATQVLDILPSFADGLVIHAQLHGTSSDLDERLLAYWLLRSIEPTEQPKIAEGVAGGVVAMDQVRAKLGGLVKSAGRSAKSEAKAADKDVPKADVLDWARQLLVSTAPYFGLKPQLAWRLRDLLHKTDGVQKALAKMSIKQWQESVVGDAIAAGSDAARSMSARDRNNLVVAFLEQRKERLDPEEVKLWIDSSDGDFGWDKRAASKGRAQKRAAKRRAAKKGSSKNGAANRASQR